MQIYLDLCLLETQVNKLKFLLEKNQSLQYVQNFAVKQMCFIGYEGVTRISKTRTVVLFNSIINYFIAENFEIKLVSSRTSPILLCMFT
jgi:hypothetical protein